MLIDTDSDLCNTPALLFYVSCTSSVDDRSKTLLLAPLEATCSRPCFQQFDKLMIIQNIFVGSSLSKQLRQNRINCFQFSPILKFMDILNYM